MAQNPLIEELKALEAELFNQEKELRRLVQNRHESGLHGDSPGLAQAQAQLDGMIRDQQARIARTKELIVAKQQAILALDAAAAEAVSQGLTPEAGYAKALAEIERAKAYKWIGIGIAVLILLALVYWFILRRK